MKQVFKIALLLIIVAISNYDGMCQLARKWEDISKDGYYKADTTKKHGFTLIFINKDSLFNPVTSQRLKDAFWKIYPKEVKRFNRNSLKTITILISDEYKGVAATLNGIVKIDQTWLTKNPEDIDVITHELMHVVQGYTYEIPDRWLTDGIADYARYTFGINNEKSGWTLTPYKAGQSYNNSYRIGARFLVWLEKYKRKDIVDRLNAALHKGTYKPSIWIELTGKSADDLWAEYSSNATI
jgi:hypothetical protein